MQGMRDGKRPRSRKVWRMLLTAAALSLLVVSGSALAGKYVTGTGETPELACWNHDYRANEHARHRTTCYTSCKLAKLNFDGTLYSFRSSVPNHRGSCGKAKYDRGDIGRTEFLRRYPKPGTTPVPDSPKVPASTTPQSGIAQVQWSPGVPNSERARLIIRNPSSQWSTTVYQVSVRDSRYSFPARIIEAGQVNLPPNGSWAKEYHQWGAADWSASWE